MSVVLTAMPDRGTAKSLTLRPQQSARVGRSQWLEFCVEDPRLAEEHFEVRYGEPPEIVSLTSGPGLRLGGRPAARLTLSLAQPEPLRFHAGGTEFRVQWTAAPRRSGEHRATGPDEAQERVRQCRSALRQGAAQLGLPASAAAPIELSESPQDYCCRLAEAGQQREALLVLLYWLPIEAAIAAVYRAMSDAGALGDTAAQACGAWLTTRGDSQRLDCVAILEGPHAPEGASKYLLEAIRYTGGSLAPEGQPEIPPPNTLPALALRVAIRLLGVEAPEFNTATWFEETLAAWTHPDSIQPTTEETGCHLPPD